MPQTATSAADPGPPAWNAFWSREALSGRILAYALAILLPMLSSAIMSHSAVLRTIPFSLYFISISVVAVLGGLAPALIAVAFCVLSRNLFIAPGEPLLAFDPAGLYRLTVLFVCAILVSALDRRRVHAIQRVEAAHKTLRERTDALVETLNSSKCASWHRDFRLDRAAEWYSGSYPVFGRPFEELRDRATLFACLHPEEIERLPVLDRLMHTSTDPIIWEFRVIWPSGDLHYLEMRGTRVPGEAIVWRGVTVDITERKLAETALLRSEKLAAMGRIASTVAHEINNPLESVTNLLYLAHNDPGLPDSVRAYLATAEQELARLGDITRLTLGFVRNSGVARDLELASVADEVLSIFRHRLESRHIRITRDFSPGIRAHLAPHELRQILTNLISNAADAVTENAPWIAIRIFREDDLACLTVADNGTGISPAALPRIFEPFFTTKQDVGTGIGLWVTRELVETNHGTISVESGDLPDGLRTRFHIALPLVQDYCPGSVPGPF